MTPIQDALNIFKEGRFRIISESMMEIDKETVSKTKRLTCSCEHQSYTKQEGLCRHKIFFLLYPLLEKLDRFSNEFEGYLNGADLVNEEYNKLVIRDFSDKLKRFEFK